LAASLALFAASAVLSAVSACLAALWLAAAVSPTRRVSAGKLSASALVCAASSAMRLPSAGSLRWASIARPILSSHAVTSAGAEPFCAAAGGGGGLGGGFEGAVGADVSEAAVPPGVVSREGMTPLNQSAAA